MIEVREFSKSLPTLTLQDISFHLPKGYIMGLVGENGAGKTTLLKSLLGLYKADCGEICIDGMNYPNQEKEIKDEIGFVLQEDLFCENLSLEENADLYGFYYREYSHEKFLEYCKRFSLQEKKKLKKLSKGEYLKFQFAFALSHSPKLLLLDEPTANFDSEFREEFIKILSEFVYDGKKSVILSTHITEDLDRIADYITFLHKGKLVFSKDREELAHTYMLLTGEEYKINLLPKEEVFYKEKGTYGTKVLVKYRERYRDNPAYTVDSPNIEDIMYYLLSSMKERGVFHGSYGFKELER